MSESIKPLVATRHANPDDVIALVSKHDLADVQAELRRASERARRFLCRPEFAGQPRQGQRALARRGIQAVTNVVRLYRCGGPIPHPGTIAWLLEVLRSMPVRDYAWALMEPASQDAHRRLWTDLTRRAPARYAAAPASLLGFVAWQCGDWELADAALGRALACTADYSMARLLRQVIGHRFPPTAAVLPMTPDDIAAAHGLAGTPRPGGEHAGREAAAHGCGCVIATAA